MRTNFLRIFLFIHVVRTALEVSLRIANKLTFDQQSWHQINSPNSLNFIQPIYP